MGVRERETIRKRQTERYVRSSKPCESGREEERDTKRDRHAQIAKEERRGEWNE